MSKVYWVKITILHISEPIVKTLYFEDEGKFLKAKDTLHRAKDAYQERLHLDSLQLKPIYDAIIDTDNNGTTITIPVHLIGNSIIECSESEGYDAK